MGDFRFLYLFHRFEADFSLAFAGVCRYFFGVCGQLWTISGFFACFFVFRLVFWAFVGNCGELWVIPGFISFCFGFDGCFFG